MEKIQILMSTYNGEKYIIEQIESILNQSYTNFAILIRDDGSSDSTTNILKRYEKDYDNIQIVYGDNLGVVKSFFELVRLADDSMEYYAFCDQDDFWEKNKIQDAIVKLRGRDSTLPIVYASDYKLVNEKLIPISTKGMPKVTNMSIGSSLIQNIVTGCTAVFNNSMLQYMRRPKQISNIVMHDWWLYLIASCFGELIFDDSKNIRYRQHENNVVGSTGNGLSKYIQKIKKINKRPKRQINKQAREFYQVYHDCISDESKEIISFLTDSRGGFSRVSIFWKKQYSRQSALDTIIFKVLYILGLI